MCIFFRRWLEKNISILLTSLYTYLRIIADHCRPDLINLRQKEVDFCISILRERVRFQFFNNLLTSYYE